MGIHKENIKNQSIAIWETVCDSLVGSIQFIREVWPLLLMCAITLLVAIVIADPSPPRHVLMGTGPKGSSHEVLAEKYAKFFFENGVTLELVPTKGALENIHRLMDRKDPLMAAFTISGAVPPGNVKGVQSLGSIDYHPIWFFYRGRSESKNLTRFTDMVNMRINLGASGSGTNLEAIRLLEMNGLTGKLPNLSYFSTHEAIERMAKGEIDGMLIVDAYESPNVQKLMKMEGIQVAEFSRAKAYSRLSPAFRVVEVPRGGLSLQRDWPSRDIRLVATTTEILVDDRLHPAIQELFLLAAMSINGPESFFSAEGEFPSFKNTTFPRSPIATFFYQKGPSWLTGYLPFWLAEFLTRTFFLLLPCIGIIYQLIKSMPNYYLSRVRAHINRIYGAIKAFEQDLSANYEDSHKDLYFKRIDELEREALAMAIPEVLSSDYYALRSAIAFVRDSLQQGVYLVGQQDESTNMVLAHS